MTRRKGNWTDYVKFQKALALAAGASNRHEAEAAEVAARKLMAAYEIDPVESPNGSFYNGMNFANNALLKKLRDEWRAAHPHYSYTTSKDGIVRRLRRKPKSESTRPVNTKPKRAAPVNLYEGLFDDFASVASKPKAKPKPKPTAKPVNTKPGKPSSDRNRDRHSPGYMRDYMRRRRAR